MIYIEETLQEGNTEVALFIKLSTARKYYQSCLIVLNAEFTTVSSTRLKERILSLNKNLEATSGKKEVCISYKDDLAGALEYTREHSTDKNATHLSKAAKIIRKEMLEMTQDFNGTFAENCPLNFVPQSLLSMIYMLIGSARNEGGDEIFKPAMSIAQLIQLNSALKRTNSTSHRYSSEKETPLSIYIAFLVHSETRSRVLIDKIHDHGLCISYHCMLTLSTSIGNTVCSQFERDNIVSPSILRLHLFTTHTVDSVGHNPSSRSAKDSFHGTAITTTQHLEHVGDGNQRQIYPFQKSKGYYTLRKLPTDYTAIKPFVLKTNDVYVVRLVLLLCCEVSKPFVNFKQ